MDNLGLTFGHLGVILAHCWLNFGQVLVTILLANLLVPCWLTSDSNLAHFGHYSSFLLNFGLLVVTIAQFCITFGPRKTDLETLFKNGIEEDSKLENSSLLGHD